MEDYSEWTNHVVAYVDDFISSNEVKEPVSFLDSLIEELEELKKQYQAMETLK